MENETIERHACLTIQFEGRVQGVGFRFAVADLATRYPVVGYVRNEYDGSVRVVAQGEKTVLEAFVQDIYRSHVGGGIRNEHREWSKASGAYRRFEIRYD